MGKNERADRGDGRTKFRAAKADQSTESTNNGTLPSAAAALRKRLPRGRIALTQS
jgi:hypothetical protein